MVHHLAITLYRLYMAVLKKWDLKASGGNAVLEALATLPKSFLLTLVRRTHRQGSDNFNEFVILLVGQHKYDVNFSNNCPTCGRC